MNVSCSLPSTHWVRKSFRVWLSRTTRRTYCIPFPIPCGAYRLDRVRVNHLGSDLTRTNASTLVVHQQVVHIVRPMLVPVRLAIPSTVTLQLRTSSQGNVLLHQWHEQYLTWNATLLPATGQPLRINPISSSPSSFTPLASLVLSGLSVFWATCLRYSLVALRWASRAFGDTSADTEATIAHRTTGTTDEPHWLRMYAPNRIKSWYRWESTIRGDAPALAQGVAEYVNVPLPLPPTRRVENREDVENVPPNTSNANQRSSGGPRRNRPTMELLPSKMHLEARARHLPSGPRSPTGTRSPSGSRSPTSPTDNRGWDALWTVHEMDEEGEEADRAMDWKEPWHHHQAFQPISEEHSADLSLVRPDDVPLPPSFPSHSASLNSWSTKSSESSQELRALDKLAEEQRDPVGPPEGPTLFSALRDMGLELAAQALNQSSDDEFPSSVLPSLSSRTIGQDPSSLAGGTVGHTSSEPAPVPEPSHPRGREALEETIWSLGRLPPVAPAMSRSSADQGRTDSSSIRTSIPQPLSSSVRKPLSTPSSPADGSSSPIHTSDPEDHYPFGSSSSPTRPPVDVFNPCSGHRQGTVRSWRPSNRPAEEEIRKAASTIAVHRAQLLERQARSPRVRYNAAVRGNLPPLTYSDPIRSITMGTPDSIRPGVVGTTRMGSQDPYRLMESRSFGGDRRRFSQFLSADAGLSLPITTVAGPSNLAYDAQMSRVQQPVVTEWQRKSSHRRIEPQDLTRPSVSSDPLELRSIVTSLQSTSTTASTSTHSTSIPTPIPILGSQSDPVPAALVRH